MHEIGATRSPIENGLKGGNQLRTDSSEADQKFKVQCLV